MNAQPSRIEERLTCTVPEAARLLGIGRDAAYRAATTGTLPTLRLGRRLVVPVPKLLALLGATNTTTGMGGIDASASPGEGIHH